MAEEKRKSYKRNAGDRDLTDYFKRAIGYTDQQGVSKSIKVPATKLEPKKVTNTVGTFLTNNSSEAMVTKCQPLKRSRKRLPMGAPSHGGNLLPDNDINN